MRTTVRPPVGTWYFLLEADTNGSLAEADKSNNVLAVPITVQAPPIRVPDLKVESITASPDPLIAGSSATLSVTVRNAGGAATSHAWSDGLFLSQDPTLSADDMQIAGLSFVSGALDPDASYTRVWTVTVPTVGPGTWYLVTLIDQWGEISEINEQNNVVAQPIGILEPTPTPTLSATDTPTPTPTSTPTAVPTDTPTPLPD